MQMKPGERTQFGVMSRILWPRLFYIYMTRDAHMAFTLTVTSGEA